MVSNICGTYSNKVHIERKKNAGGQEMGQCDLIIIILFYLEIVFYCPQWNSFGS